MFQDKAYWEVNREERFYCALFAHAVLSSPKCRAGFVNWACQRFDVDFDPEEIEVYLEVAALRDYWSDLGDPVRYDSETHRRRRAVLDVILASRGVASNTVDAEPLFWTSGVGSKLWSPGRWNLERLEAAGLGALKPVRWAFNAKPDMLIMSPSGAIAIEAKVESGTGRDKKAGYDQLEIQQLITQLWTELIPVFSRMPVHLTTLLLKPGPGVGLSWMEVIDFLENDEVDNFTKKCLARLAKYRGTA